MSPLELPPAGPPLLREIELPTAVLGLAPGSPGILHAACLDGGIHEVPADGGPPVLLARHGNYASGVLRLPGTPWLVSGGYDGALLWIDPAKRTVERRVEAHAFWSWQIAASSSGLVASATGQYLCGGYKYEPLPEREPSVKVFDANGSLVHAFSHVPPVLSVAFSPDGKLLAAGNLMGEIRVWDLSTGALAATWTTPSFTGWGIIKGHYYTGGIFALHFTPDGKELLLAGMGSTIDPAAGNGLQLWERWDWSASPPRKVDETHRDESGQGLMETLSFHPRGDWFVMAGRLFQGKWSAAIFDGTTGALRSSWNTKTRVIKAVHAPDASRLYLAGAVGQGKRKPDGTYPSFGRIAVHELPLEERAF